MYLRNSMIIIDQGNFKKDDYFKHVELVKSKECIIIKAISESEKSKTEIGTEVNKELVSENSDKYRFVVNPAKLPTEENSLDFLEQNSQVLVQIAPTELDYDALTIEEQIKFDKRSFYQIVVGKTEQFHIYINAFFYKYLLVPQHFRLFVLMTSMLVNMSMNAFFYSDEMINKREKNNTSVFI